MYAEKLAMDIGMYSTSLTMIGHLIDEMLRAARLVVDTGIHHLGWSRQRAIDYMVGVCPLNIKTNEMEIDRYIGWPGQATSYKVGQLKIMELKQNILNNGTSLQEFNTRMIESGAMPIDMIGGHITHRISNDD